MEERDDEKRKLLQTAHVIAVVGLSPDAEKASNVVGKYLMAHGYRVIPVNPGQTQVLGQRSYPALSDIPEKVDIVNIFRRSQDALPVVKEAIALAPKAIWLQLGITNDEAKRIAEENGISFYMDQCIKVEHSRIIGK